MLECICKYFTLENIVGLVVILSFLYTIWHNWQKKAKLRPRMVSLEYLSDEYGRRLLFTVIPNNPVGSEILKKPLKVERIIKNPFKKNIAIHLPFISNDSFLNKNIHFNDIPNWVLKQQTSFVAILNENHLAKKGIYKATFYTSDGSCSKTLVHRLVRLY